MGLKDRVKERAQELASEARKATTQAQGKLEETVLRRRMDDAARRLGYLVFRERTQGTPAASDADALVDEMRTLDEGLTRHRMGVPENAGDPGAPESSGSAPIEKTQPGAPPPQSPPEGHPTDQPTS